MNTDVIVVGAGPVGLSLAIDLGQRGVRTLLVERKSGPLRLPKMERTNPRSMEIFRRLGVAPRIRERGLHPDGSMDIFLVSSLSKPPLARIQYPTVNQARALCDAARDGTQPREPWQLISQYTLEPLLIERLRELPSVTLMFDTELDSFEQDASGVRARLRPTDGGDAVLAEAQYLAAADGANSRVRAQLGIEMEGRRDLGTLTNVFFRCDDLLAKSRVPQGRHFQFVNHDPRGGSGGSVVMQDDMKHFGYHTAGTPDEDTTAFLRRELDLDIDPTVLHIGPWTQNMLVSTTHRVGRVFLAGDANHIYIPAGGLGMNTGVVDAINLGWKLAAAVAGWGGEALLESYNVERNAIARRTLGFVAYAVEGSIKMRDGFAPSMLADTPEAKAALQAYLEKAVPFMRRVYDMVGADRGYRYLSSVIAAEAGDPPPDDAYVYVPSTFPGSHLPNLWLAPGDSVYDHLGVNFALLRCAGATANTAPVIDAFRALGAPLDVIDLPPGNFRDIYQRDLLLVRPDLHVAWRGDNLPTDATQLAATVTGGHS